MGVAVQETTDKPKARKKKLPQLQENLAQHLAQPNVKSVRSAAIKAGYAESTASVDVYKILEQPRFIDRLAERKAELAALANTTPQQIVGGVVELAYGEETGEKTRLGALKTLGGWNGLDVAPADNPHNLKAQSKVEVILEYTLPERYPDVYESLTAQEKVELLCALFAEKGTEVPLKLQEYALKFAENL